MKASTQRLFGIMITAVAVLLAIVETVDCSLGGSGCDVPTAVCAAAGIFGGGIMWHDAARRLKEKQREND